MTCVYKEYMKLGAMTASKNEIFILGYNIKIVI